MPPDIPLLTGRYGFRVFPIRHKSRTPAIPRWPEAATADLDEARALWRRVNLTAPFNAGVVADGLCIVDIDQKPLSWESVPDPRTFRVATSRGEHWYFTTDLPIKSGPLYKGEVDLKCGEGAMVIAPGSTHPSGAVYTVIDDRPPAELPRWLEDQFRAAGRVGASRRANLGENEFLTIPTKDEEPDEDHPILIEAIRASLSKIDGKGNRNQSLFQVALGIWRDYGSRLITRQTTIDLLREACHTVIASDFSKEEASRTVNSAYRSVFGEDQ